MTNLESIHPQDALSLEQVRSWLNEQDADVQMLRRHHSEDNQVYAII